MVAVACFLPGRTKDLSAPPCFTSPSYMSAVKEPLFVDAASCYIRVRWVTVTPWVPAEPSGSRGLIPETSTDVSVFRATQTGCRFHPSFYPVGTGIPVTDRQTPMTLAQTRKYLEKWLSCLCCSRRDTLGILITAVTARYN